MARFFTIAATLYSVTHLANALPTEFLSARQEHQGVCSAGNVYYVCANGYKGCFPADPCWVGGIHSPEHPDGPIPPSAPSTGLPPYGTPAPPSAPTSTPSPAPVPTGPAICPSAGQTANLTSPSMYNVYPSQPWEATAPHTYLQFALDHNGLTTHAVAVFSGLPATAKNCKLGWQQSERATRTKFEVVGNGLADVLELDGLESQPVGEPISLNHVQSVEGKNVLTPDFTAWNDMQVGRVHSSGEVMCKDEMAFEIKTNGVNGDGHVWFDQNAQNGLYVTYEC